MLLLFVYGTLIYPEVREKLLGRYVYLTPNTLSGYKTEKIDIDNIQYPILVEDISSMVHGGIILVSEEEIALLDTYETDAYKRSLVTLMDGKEVWVYM